MVQADAMNATRKSLLVILMRWAKLGLLIKSLEYFLFKLSGEILSCSAIFLCIKMNEVRINLTEFLSQ